MFWKLHKHVDRVFLDTTTQMVWDENSRLDIILSPSLYWVKKVSLPVESVKEARPLVESLFEEILPEGEYSYFVSKEEDFFTLFAYEDKKIVDRLQEIGLELGRVRNIYFAQNEYKNSKDVIYVNETQSMVYKNDVLILVPSMWYEQSKKVDIKSLELSSSKVKLKTYAQIIDSKTLFSIVGILVLFTLLLSVEYFTLKRSTTELEQKKEKLFTKYKMKPTMLQNRSIVKSYEQTYAQQKELRAFTSLLFSLKLIAGESMQDLRYKNRRIVVVFKGVKPSREESIRSYFKKKNEKIETKKSGSLLSVELKV